MEDIFTTYQKAMIHIRIMMVICMNLLLHQLFLLGGCGGGVACFVLD